MSSSCGNSSLMVMFCSKQLIHIVYHIQTYHYILYVLYYCIVLTIPSLLLYRFSLYSSSSLYGGYSSSFSGGGACLSHDHNTQFRFVLQSFTLWKEIMTNMPKLWLLADHDMTHEQYRLVEL